MASSIHRSGGASTEAGISFPKPVGHLLVWIDFGATFSISFDNKTNFFNLEPGSHSLPVGLTKLIHITSSGSWQMVGVQT